MSLKIITTSNWKTSKEEIVLLEAIENTNLDGFAIVDHTFNDEGESNVFRHIFMFPDYNVFEGEHIVLLSCKGSVDSKFDKNGRKIHYFYWGSDTCIWNDNGGDEAILIKYTETGRKTVGPV